MQRIETSRIAAMAVIRRTGFYSPQGIVLKEKGPPFGSPIPNFELT
ncbi:hypothetical protein [Roseovarius aestuarii]